jgi:hypothetical protein
MAWASHISFLFFPSIRYIELAEELCFFVHAANQNPTTTMFFQHDTPLT